MKIKPITQHQLQRIHAADELLKRAVASLVVGDCPRAADAVRRARKSTQGAIRHAQRRWMHKDDARIDSKGPSPLVVVRLGLR